jgi:hypothetical protein
MGENVCARHKDFDGRGEEEMANLSRVLSLLTALFFLLPTAAKEGATSVVEVLKQDTFDEATKEVLFVVCD